ncbi:bacteriocin ABC transporter ATP-binding protein, partial [Escherichia coli]
LINGQKISRKNRKTFFREQAGFLFQNYALIDNETVKQNLTLVSKEEQKIKESLEKFQVDHLIDKKIFLLS